MGEAAGGTIAFGLALVLTPLVIVGLRGLDVLDHPNARSSHDAPVIRGGGLAVATATVVAGALALDTVTASHPLGLILAAVAFGAIGLAEDLFGIRALPRFLLQLAAAAVASRWLLDGLSGPMWWRVVFAGGTVAWLIAYVNGFNFMDGVNGISAVQTALAGAAWAWLGDIYGAETLTVGGLVLAGACLGFLPYNFPRARIFLGDSGSYFIGGWQAALLVVGLRAGIEPEAVVAPVAVYLADTGSTLIRRFLAGAVWHEPHREHTYQRLLISGWSHVRTTLTVGCFVAATTMLGMLATTSLVMRVVADVSIVALLVLYLRLPRLLVSAGGQRAKA